CMLFSDKCYIIIDVLCLKKIFHSSSVVEQSAVNRSVVGSNPTCGAIWRAVRVVEGARLEIVCAVNAVPRVQIPRSPPLYIGPLVKRLRHRPFTAVTRVRIPYGSPSED